jgi:putative PIG3 family NAD(P)H quinone oxidoreductase
MSMKVVIAEKPGDESVLKLAEVPDPVLKPEEIMIGVTHAGLNRADLMQRQGFYPPPPGASEIIGMECAGRVIEVGPKVTGWKVGERAMALLPGGGYAEKAAAHHGSAMHVPEVLSDAEAAGLPEVFLTAYLNLFILAEVKFGDAVLVHGGGSGVGTASILLLKEAGARSIVTAGSDEKCNRCLKLGADIALNYNTAPFASQIKTVTNGRGVDIILDSIGAQYLMPNIESLAHGGRLVLIGLMRGNRSEIDLMPVLRKHLKIMGSTLRSRSEAEKAEIVTSFMHHNAAALEQGRLRPPIYKVVPASEAAEAHRMMAASEHFGKIILKFG